MADQASISWDEFVRDCARQVIDGNLTTQYMKSGLRQLACSSYGGEIDFHAEIKNACNNLGSPLAGSYALDLEIRAASNRLDQLVKRRSSDETAA